MADHRDAAHVLSSEESCRPIVLQEESANCIKVVDADRMGVGIPLIRKISYAVGGMPYQLTNVTKGFFLQIFLLDVVQMDAFYASLILFLGRAWDAITDPLVGYLVSKSKKTRFGKLIPWIVFSMPLGVVSYVMMWFVPRHTMAPGVSFTWFFMWTCLFDLFMSCYHVPYSSLNMFLGGEQKARDSATGYRMSMEVFATLAGAIIQGQIVGEHHANKARACRLLANKTIDSQNLTSTLRDSLQNARWAYVVAALVMVSIYFLCCLVLFLGVKEQSAPLSTLNKIQIPFQTGLKMVARHTPYVKLVFGFLFCSLAFQMAQGNFALFCTHATELGSYFQHIILVLLTAATLSVPMWQTLLGKLGKKTTLFIGLSIYIPTLLVIVVSPSKLPLFIFMATMAGSSLATLYLIPWSMLPDIVDDFKVKNSSCKNMEPLFFSCFVFFNKFGGGLAIGISTLVLHLVGYKPGECKQDSAVTFALQILFAPVPIILLLIGMVVFYFYPINEQRRQEIQMELHKATSTQAHD